MQKENKEGEVSKEEVEEVIKDTVKTPEKTTVPPKVELLWRKIVILTNGNDIKLEKAETAGRLELLAVLESLIGFINKKE